MKYLLSIGLGPVQGFIEAGRKTRDLYAGSHILSEVAKAAALEMGEKTLIFPWASAEELRGEEFSATNKLLALVETEKPRDLAERAQLAAKGRLAGLAGGIRPAAVKYEEQRVLAHLDGLLEFYAAWTPCAGSEEYIEARDRVEQLLNGRKALRAFAPHDGIAGRRKCSLDGECETVILGRGDSARDRIRLRENEELDGPALLKRFLDIEPRFESTVAAAALPYMHKVARLAHEQLADLERMNGEAGLPRDSGELLFEFESRKVFKEEPAELKKLEDLKTAIYKCAGKPAVPYYALMVADGDSMGEALSGLGLEEHRELSRSLSEFSRDVRHALDSRECMTIFAGGDDVLAIVPLHRLREAVWAVRKLFQRVRRGLTISAGIAVAHALEPLGEVRAEAKKAERDAKRVDGKNAVSIKVLPRSGAPVQATGKWEAMGPALGEIVTAYREGRLSFGFAHELRQLLDRTHPDLDPVLPRMAGALAQKKDKDDSAAPELVGKAEGRPGLEDLMNRMLVARKIARAEMDAEAAS